jgi:branched-chain amino acid aminotransferase
MHRLLLYNDQLVETSVALLSPGQVGYLNGWGVFSTIRVSDGVLFAWERHWARMHRDAALMRVPFPEDSGWMHSHLMKLVEANEAREATLRVAVIRNRGGMFEGEGISRDFDMVAFTTYLKDWGTSVKLALVPHGRHAASRFAGVKVTSWAQNLVCYEEAHARGFDEALLLNERGEVSECTSANILAAKGDTVFTPPLHSGCLPGVTRELLLDAVHAPGLAVRERDLLPADLEDMDEVFMTSTTRDLLPVVEIEGLRIRSKGTARERLNAAFQRYIQEYVAGVRVR